MVESCPHQKIENKLRTIQLWQRVNCPLRFWWWKWPRDTFALKLGSIFELIKSKWICVFPRQANQSQPHARVCATHVDKTTRLTSNPVVSCTGKFIFIVHFIQCFGNLDICKLQDKVLVRYTTVTRCLINKCEFYGNLSLLFWATWTSELNMKPALAKPMNYFWSISVV